MTIQECGKILLGHFPFEEREIPDNPTYPGRNAEVVAAMNAALEECYSRESPWIRETEIGEILRPPATVSVAVTASSRDITITGWESWMAGCTIVLDGHDIDNQIRDDEAENRLKFPYAGSSGTVNGTIYHDCITLADDVVMVVPPIKANGIPVLSLTAGDSVTDPLNRQDYGMIHNPSTVVEVETRRASVLLGKVYGASIENHSPAGKMVPVNRMRLYGSVSSTGSLSYKAKLRPPLIEDLECDDVPPIPHEHVSSVFLPIARQKLVGCPFFRDQSGKEEIANAYKEAKATLASIRTTLPRRFRFQH